jgi:hypothetical protein
MKIEGLPAIKDRPRCVNCRRPLKHWTDDTRGPNPNGGTMVVRKVFASWRGYPQGGPLLFDTLRCALEFAVVLYKAGYRRHQA